MRSCASADARQQPMRSTAEQKSVQLIGKFTRKHCSHQSELHLETYMLRGTARHTSAGCSSKSSMSGGDPLSETGTKGEGLDGFLDELWDDEKLDAWIDPAGEGACTMPVALFRGAGMYTTTCSSTTFVNKHLLFCMCIILSASKGASEYAVFRSAMFPCALTNFNTKHVMERCPQANGTSKQLEVLGARIVLSCTSCVVLSRSTCIAWCASVMCACDDGLQTLQRHAV